MMAIAIGSLLPQIVFEVFYARSFDVTTYADRVHYEFTSNDDMLDFAMFN